MAWMGITQGSSKRGFELLMVKLLRKWSGGQSKKIRAIGGSSYWG